MSEKDLGLPSSTLLLSFVQECSSSLNHFQAGFCHAFTQVTPGDHSENVKKGQTVAAYLSRRFTKEVCYICLRAYALVSGLSPS